MNVTMLVLNNFTNDARVHKEASTLVSAGYTVSVVSLWKPGLAQTEEQSGYQIIRLRLLSRPWKNRLFSPIVKYIEFAWRVWSLAGAKPAQIFHANDANTLPAAWLAAKRNHALLVYDAHELETDRNFGGSTIAKIYQSIWAFPEKLFIKKAHSVLTENPSYAAIMTKYYRIKTPHVIMNCPEKTTYQHSDRLRQELNIPTGTKILISQGRVSAGRGIETFLDAIQKIDNAVGVILGDGPSLKDLRERLNSGEWKRVYLPGKVSLVDLPSYSASADLGMVLIQDTCLSYRFTLPNKLFEYLHAGLPVVCSDLPEMARVVREYEVGELTDPEDPIAIAHSVQAILSTPDRLVQMKANAIKSAEVFNWQNESKKLLEIYQNLANNFFVQK